MRPLRSSPTIPSLASPRFRPLVSDKEEASLVDSQVSSSFALPFYKADTTVGVEVSLQVQHLADGIHTRYYSLSSAKREGRTRIHRRDDNIPQWASGSCPSGALRKACGLLARYADPPAVVTWW